MIRSLSWMLLAAGGFALVSLSGPIQGRQPAKDELPKQPPEYSSVSAFKNASSISANDMKKAKDAFAAFAKYNAEYISHAKVYSTPQEFIPPAVKFGGPVQTTDQLITELNRHILIPLPDSKIDADKADYIRELGAALDKELKAVIEQNPAPVVRVNAMRMLAGACKSGATAHYSTITNFISNANTPVEVKYYAFQAAGNLLSAYDLNDYQPRKHSHKAPEVTALIMSLQNAITKPAGIVPAPAGGSMSPEQIEVIQVVRRQAIRALAQARFSDRVFPNGPETYPGFTLAQIATSDPAIVPAPSETEVAEAVIGICNMSPPAKAAEKEPYAYAMADAVSTGIITFASRRAASPLDKSVAWRGYAARLSDAVKHWRPLFDPTFTAFKPLGYSPAAIPKVIEDLAADADKRVLIPIYEANGTVDVNGLKQFRETTIRASNKYTLNPFVSNPKLTLTKHN